MTAGVAEAELLGIPSLDSRQLVPPVEEPSRFPEEAR